MSGDGADEIAADADWSLPATWAAEHRAMVLVAQDLRAEAQMFEHEFYAARQAGQMERAHDLHLSMMHAKTRAAKIERKIRMIPQQRAEDES